MTVCLLVLQTSKVLLYLYQCCTLIIFKKKLFLASYSYSIIFKKKLFLASYSCPEQTRNDLTKKDLPTFIATYLQTYLPTYIYRLFSIWYQEIQHRRKEGRKRPRAASNELIKSKQPLAINIRIRFENHVNRKLSCLSSEDIF